MFKLTLKIIGCDIEGRFKTATSETITRFGSKAEIEGIWAELSEMIVKCPSKRFQGYEVKIIEI